MSYYADNYGSAGSNNHNSGGYGNSYGRDFLMEEDPNLTPEERRRIPGLAQRVISRLYEVDPQSAAMLLGELASEIREEGHRGPVIDETIVYLEERRMARRMQWEGAIWVQALSKPVVETQWATHG